MFPGSSSEHVRRVCTTRALLVCVAVTIGLSFPRLASAQTLANGWQTSAVGSPALPGSATDAECVQPAVSACAALTVTAGGVDIWGSSDQFRFVYQRLTGDAVVIARIESIEWAHAWSKAGVMMRESLDPGARTDSRSSPREGASRSSGGGSPMVCRSTPREVTPQLPSG
jgi:hypothetical protein